MENSYIVPRATFGIKISVFYNTVYGNDLLREKAACES